MMRLGAFKKVFFPHTDSRYVWIRLGRPNFDHGVRQRGGERGVEGQMHQQMCGKTFASSQYAVPSFSFTLLSYNRHFVHFNWSLCPKIFGGVGCRCCFNLCSCSLVLLKRMRVCYPAWEVGVNDGIALVARAHSRADESPPVCSWKHTGRLLLFFFLHTQFVNPTQREAFPR